MNPDLQQMHGILAAFIGVYAIFYLMQAVIFIVPTWFISKKAGFSPWLSLLNIVPMGNLVLIYVLAFADWKVAPTPPATWASGYPPPPPMA